jgi:hypothetical protein
MVVSSVSVHDMAMQDVALGSANMRSVGVVWTCMRLWRA